MTSNKLKVFISLIFSISIFISCIYEPEGLGQTGAKYPDSQVPMDITLSPDKDSLIIYGNTNITFNVNSFGLKCSGVRLEYLSKSQEYYSSSGSFTLEPVTEGQWMDLKASIYLKTGSGSIADLLDAENYMGTKTWKIKYISFYNYSIPIYQRINKDSCLEVYWIKPNDIPLSNVSFTGIPFTKQKADTMFYVDTTFYGGNKYVELYYKLPGQSYNKSSYLSINYPYPEISVQQISFDSCRISWPSSKLRWKYILNKGGASSVYVGNKNSFTDANPLLGTTCSYSLRILKSSAKSNFDYLANSYSVSYQIGYNAPTPLCYNQSTNEIYGGMRSYQDNMFGVYTFPFNASSPSPVYDCNLIDCNTNGSIVAFQSSLSSSEIKVYKNKFLSPLTIYGERYYSNYLQVADDGSVGYFTNVTGKRKYTVKNYGSDLSWQEFSFYPHFNDSTGDIYMCDMILMKSGKYLCCRGDYDFYIYDISDHLQAKVVYTAPHDSYNRMAEIPNQQNQIVIGANDGIEIRTIPDFKLIKKYNDTASSVLIMNIDPVSGLLLTFKEGYFCIVNIETMKEVYRIKAASGNEYKARLYNNHLFFKSRVIDLTSKLN